jgi:hypothetical protein
VWSNGPFTRVGLAASVSAGQPKTQVSNLAPAHRASGESAMRGCSGQTNPRSPLPKASRVAAMLCTGPAESGSCLQCKLPGSPSHPVSTLRGELVQAARAGERRHSEPGGQPLPRIVSSHKVPGVSVSRGLVSHRVSLSPTCQPNRRVSLRPRTPSSRRRSLAFPSTTPALLARRVLDRKQRPAAAPACSAVREHDSDKSCPDVAEALWRHLPLRARAEPPADPPLAFPPKAK